MGWFGKKSPNAAPNRNRCSGCEHYNGFASDKRTVFCALKVKSTIDVGCGSFTPDKTAACDECIYRNTSLGEYFCSKHDACYDSEQSYCQDYVEKWNI